ncbi:MAG: protein kinase [Gemmatimonadota bacterium]
MDGRAAPVVAGEDASADALRDALEEAVGGEYEIVRLIGRGGMGAVYLARDRALERLVAIKVLPPGSATDAGVLERFRREAKTVASLQHVGIVPLYAFGERRGLCWFVMGYVRGESLATRLEREPVLEVETARTLLAQVAEALDHAHRQGIVHRDIKPDNILLDDGTGRAMLTDFGIARADTLSAATSLTQVGSVMGTPHYMSPEQATAEPQIDGRSDLYSVGVVGYQLLSGKLPFDGRSFRELLMQHVSATPQPLLTIAPTVPPDVADAVMRCLEKDPARRFADGRSLRAALGGEIYDDESLSYELAELRHLGAWFFLSVVVSVTVAVTAAVTGGRLLGVPALAWLLIPLMFVGYVSRAREARQRGFEWATIRRVVTLPPRWWWLWWPRAWRRTGDVYERLPATLKTARWLNTVIAALLLVEMPLMTWAMDDRRRVMRELAPPSHAWHSIRWVAALDALIVIVVLLAFLAALMSVLLVATSLARRAAKPHGLSRLDSNRLTYKPTDSPFWRDARIQSVLRGSAVERKPATPQDFVSQILVATGRLTPASGAVNVESAAAARRLSEAIAAFDREIAMLEKTAPREQIDRLDAEIVLLEADGTEAESIALLRDQRETLARSRERMQVLHTRRETALAELETLWSDVRRLASTVDPATMRDLAERIGERCRAVQQSYPPRRGRTTTTSGAAAALLLLLTLSVGAVQAARVSAAGVAEVRPLLARGEPDSALVMLAAMPATVERNVLEGEAHLVRGHRRDLILRLMSARRAMAAFDRALQRDSTQVAAITAQAWIKRLLPAFIGGDSDEADALLVALQRQAPYRAQLMRGYFARLDGRGLLADSLVTELTVSAPDSAGAWFALGELAFRDGRAEVARDAWLRYHTLMPTDRAVLYQLGMVSAVHGVALDDGERTLREYLATPPLMMHPTAGAAWWRLGQVLEKQGRIAPARAAYGKAISLDRRSSDYKASLALLDARRVGR